LTNNIPTPRPPEPTDEPHPTPEPTPEPQSTSELSHASVQDHLQQYELLEILPLSDYRITFLPVSYRQPGLTAEMLYLKLLLTSIKHNIEGCGRNPNNQQTNEVSREDVSLSRLNN